MNHAQEPVSVEHARSAIDAAGGLVTPQQIALEWGISPVSVAERIRNGRFPEPVARAGRVRLYLRAQVEAYRHPARARRAGSRVE